MVYTAACNKCLEVPFPSIRLDISRHKAWSMCPCSLDMDNTYVYKFTSAGIEQSSIVIYSTTLRMLT